MKHLLLSLFAVAGIFSLASAQNFQFGEISPQELDMKQYEKDLTAHAVVLKEFGKTYISTADGLPLEHEYHVKIKIFDSKAFDQGNIKIYTYKGSSDTYEEISDVEAITFYKDDNGFIQQSKLDSKKIIRENINQHHDVVKFAMPNVRNGCIIEYSYRLKSPYRFNFRNWEFQSDIPKIYSEYEAHIPAVYNYNVSMRGAYKLSKNTSELERECFSYYGAKADCSKITYAMSDVPAFVEEDFMTSAKNYLSAIYFELVDYTDLQNGVKHKITKEWRDVDRDLKADDNFGGQLKRKSLMRERIAAVVAGKTDTLEKAKAIYNYIQKNIKWNRFYSAFSVDGIKTALDKHSGSTGDINLALITALNAADINTEAVMLSTRDHGLINKLYPVESDFNDVVAKVNIGNKSYLLDAADPMLPFGLLPMRCINDQGRVVSLDKPSYWIDLTASQKKSKTYLLDLTLQDDGKFKGTITHYSLGYEAYEKRIAIKKFNSIDEYVENLDEKMPKIKILKSEILNLDTLDAPLTEKYEIEYNAYDNLNHDRISFNPFMMDRVTENPFKLADRSFPVDMGAATDTRIILTLHLPDQFTLESNPEPVNVAMPNQGGRFMTSFNNENGLLTFSHIMQLTHAVYSTDEYPYLKELYNKIIQSEKASLVFHKKS